MDQYLHWDSNHHITAKQSVYNTLGHRAKIISSTQDKLDRELQHIRTALQHCQFPDWALNQWHHKFTNPNQPTTTTTNNNNPPANKKEHYHSSSLHAKHRRKVQEIVQKEGTNTLRTALGNPKDKNPKNNQTGIIITTNTPK